MTRTIPAATVALACLFVLAAVCLSACDASVLDSSPPTICTESGSQCQLPTGPLGVCERSPCPAGATGPCYACISQH